MDNVPITFDHKGKEYTGYFSKVMGAGSSSTFHLMIDEYYVGQLFYSQVEGWAFYSNSIPELHDLSQYFGEYITNWYQ